MRDFVGDSIDKCFLVPFRKKVALLTIVRFIFK